MKATLGDADGLASGTMVKVYVTAEKADNVMVVPADCVNYSNGDAYVYTYDAATSTAKKTPVEDGLKTMTSFSGDIMCEVALPNREIALVYNKEILQRLGNMIPQSTAIAIQEAIFSGDNHRLKTQIQMLLTQSVSSFDTAGENFYHGFMLGLCALMNGAFATSNRESGDGRYDIQLKRRDLNGA